MSNAEQDERKNQAANLLQEMFLDQRKVMSR
jgi:hypothetical protein